MSRINISKPQTASSEVDGRSTFRLPAALSGVRQRLSETVRQRVADQCIRFASRTTAGRITCSNEGAGHSPSMARDQRRQRPCCQLWFLWPHSSLMIRPHMYRSQPRISRSATRCPHYINSIINYDILPVYAQSMCQSVIR